MKKPVGMLTVDRHTLTFYFFRYHLKDVIVGKIYFLLVRIKIKHMELQVIKRDWGQKGKKTKIYKHYTEK
jgi:hypothetical protein